MAGLIPFNRRDRSSLMNLGAGFEDFHNMLDDFFGGSVFQGRNLLHDTFKLDIEEKDAEFVIEAELPGIQKDEIDLSVEDDNLNIRTNRTEDANKEGKNFIHRERRSSSMSRRVRLVGANLDDISAEMEDGVLRIFIPKDNKANSTRKIAIN